MTTVRSEWRRLWLTCAGLFPLLTVMHHFLDGRSWPDALVGGMAFTVGMGIGIWLSASDRAVPLLTDRAHVPIELALTGVDAALPRGGRSPSATAARHSAHQSAVRAAGDGEDTQL